MTCPASDGAGIRKVELVDVTNPLAPAVVGAEDYAEVRTGANRICDFSQPAPCPNLSRETVQATSLPAGPRSVTVRVTDTGGNVVERGPYPVFAVTPSDRGAANGANATETGALSMTWTTGGNKRRTLSYGRKAGVRGRLVNAVRRADRRRDGPAAHAVTCASDAALIPRTTLTTDADGTFRTTVTASASRLLQFSWLSHANDVRFAANGYLTLQARASGTLTVSTRRPRVGRTLTITGQLRGVGRGGVPIVVQGRAGGSRRYATFADTTTSSSGRFRVRYRFRSAASRGRSFVFRARIRPAPRFPYETGYSKTVTSAEVCPSETPAAAGLHEVGSRPCTVTGGESVDDLLRHGRHRLHRSPPRGAAARARGRHPRARTRGLAREARRLIGAGRSDRIKPVIGDLSEANLGVDPATLPRIDHFFHLAAIYDMGADETRNALLNVGGTQHTIDLANALDVGTFHHMSSIAVAGLYDEGTFNEDMFDEGQKLAHPYHRTKFESEKLVRERVKAPWRVYRPSLVIGDSRTGEMDKIDGPYYFFKLIQKLRHDAAGVVPADLARVGLDEHRPGRLRRRDGRPHRPQAGARRPGLPRRGPQGPARRRGAEHVRRGRPRAQGRDAHRPPRDCRTCPRAC